MSVLLLLSATFFERSMTASLQTKQNAYCTCCNILTKQRCIAYKVSLHSLVCVDSALELHKAIMDVIRWWTGEHSQGCDRFILAMEET